MRSGKRLLAGVAAGALALGALTIASAPAVSAKPSVNPKATVSATVTPVRVTLVGATREAVPFAKLSWTTSGAMAANDTIAVTLVNGPSSLSQIWLGANGTVSGAATGTVSANTYAVTTGGTLSTNLGGGGAIAAASANTTASIGIAASEPGTYTGFIKTYTTGGNPLIDTVNFSFTTTGKATSMTFTPASQTAAGGATAELLVSLKDANNNLTQPLMTATPAQVDYVTVTDPAAATVQTCNYTNTYTGACVVSYTVPSAAGSYTLTATPNGTLPSGGVTAQTAVVSSVSTSAATGLITALGQQVTSNANKYADPVAVSAGVTSVQYANPTATKIDYTVSGTPGTSVRYSVTFAGNPAANITAGTAAIGAAGTGTISVTFPGTIDGTLGTNVAGDLDTVAKLKALVSNYTLAVTGGTGFTIDTLYISPRVTTNSIASTPPFTTQKIVQTGTATANGATVRDQYFNGVAGINVNTTFAPTPATSIGSTGVTGVSGADGKVVLNASAPAATVTSQLATVSATGPGAVALPVLIGPAPNNVAQTMTYTLNYSASGTLTSVTPTAGGQSKAVAATLTQNVNTSGAVAVPNTWAANGQTGWMPVVATINPASAGYVVAFSGENLYFTDTPSLPLSATNIAAGLIDTSWAEVTGGGGAVTVYVVSTKTGVAKVDMEVGGVKNDISWKVANAATDARVLTVTPETQDSGSPAQVKATAKDAFGNAVQGVNLNFSESGVGNFASGTSVLQTATGPDGSVVVDVLSSESGDSTVTVTMAATNNSNGLANVPVTGAPAGVASGVGKIKFTGGSASKSITIVGERGTVSGKPGIIVEGTTTGLVAGKTVIPYVRFPGGEYTQGTARPAISAAGDFEWSRKTGKKAYVYFTNDDGAVSSNRIIIAAS